MKNSSIKIKATFLNLLMFNGNKKSAEKLFLQSSKKIQKSYSKKKFSDLIKIGLINSSPILFLKSIKRKRKQTIKFPFLLNNKLRTFYGFNFLLKNCFSKKSQPFYVKLETELIASCKNLSQSVKTKKDLHKEAVIKKKFANYRWF